MARKKGAKKAQSELMKMLINKDSYSENLEKNKEKRKVIVEEDKKRFPEKKEEKKARIGTDIEKELSDVIPSLIKGTKAEFKKIKSMFKKKDK